MNRPLRGRGAATNPANRFEHIAVEREPGWAAPEAGEERPETVYLRDSSRSIIATNTSSDVGFDASINPYRGCEHGCAYCYARPFHEYLGFSAGLDFETKILVKEDAPELLRRELAKPSWQPQVIALSGVTDPYQPVERTLRLTRRCLEVLADVRNPVTVISKSRLVARDADLLGAMATWGGASAALSITTLDVGLQSALEPRASSPRARLEAIAALADAGVPTTVMVAPVIPGLTDHELPAILDAAAAAGASGAGYVVLRLPHGVKKIFGAWLAHHFPQRRAKIASRLRALADGALYDSGYGRRQRGRGPFAEQIASVFEIARRRSGLDRPRPELSVTHFRRPGGEQLALFG